MVAQPVLETGEMSEREIAQTTWEIFERNITTHPERWLWAYKHFRYRPAAADREYPYYSRPHRDFEEIRGEDRATSVL